MSKVVAIVGKGPTAHQGGYEPTNVEVWGINAAWKHMGKASQADRWFHIDDTKKYTESRGFLQSFDGPVYLIYPDETIPTGIQYPVAAVEKRLQGYFHPTASYALALALFEGFDDIHLWGLDYPLGTRYDGQRACVEYWIGRAHGAGVKVQIPIESALLSSGKTSVDQWRRESALLKQISV
jgi:hypothetical protein